MSKSRRPSWEDWLKDIRTCEKSMHHFESGEMGLIKVLSDRIARENVLGHMKKAYHNLDLANRKYDMHEGELEFSYEGENFYDWVVTISYYAMYQASLAALAAVKKEGEMHAATVCALIYHFYHKRKGLRERHLISLDLIGSLARQDVQKLVEKKGERERASYDTSFMT